MRTIGEVNWCLPPGTLVITSEGLKPIEEIKEGDLVLTHKGRFRKVTKVMKRWYKGKLVKLKIGYCSEPLLITPEHPILVVRNVREKGDTAWRKVLDRWLKSKTVTINYQWVPANEVTENDFVVFPRYKSENVKNDLPEKFFLFGLYLAEGTIEGVKKGQHKGVNFWLGPHEKELAEKVKEMLEKIYNAKVKIDNKNFPTSILVQTHDKQVINDFSRFGTNSYNKKIPHDILDYDNTCLKELIKGWVIGDASIPQRSKNEVVKKYCIVVGVSVSRNLVGMLRVILAKLGILHGVYIRKNVVGKKKVIKDRKYGERIIETKTPPWEIQFSGLMTEKIFNDVKEEVLHHKGIEGYVTDEYLWFPVEEKEYVDYEGWVYNLEVEEDESYTLLQCVVHNCSIKHLLLAKVHLEETLEKLYRTCDTKCRIDNVTQEEFMEGIKHILAAEEHLIDLLSLKPELEEVRKIVDELRRLRQELTSKFLFKTEVSKDVVKVFEDAVSKVKNTIEKIKELKLPIEQEQCPRCEEDLGKLKQEYEKAVKKFSEDDVDKVCAIPTPAAIVEDVMVYAPNNELGDELAKKLVEVVESDEELRKLLKQAREKGLERIYIDCSPKNFKTIAYARLYSNGCVIHIHPVVLQQSDSCIKHVLAHELAHCLGHLTEESAQSIASRFGSCGRIVVKKKLKTRVAKYSEGKSMTWVELGGAFIGKGVQEAGKYIAYKWFSGKKPHERPDFYIDIVSGAISIGVALWKKDKWYGKLALGYACKVVPDLIDYVVEYVGSPTLTMYTGEEYLSQTTTSSEVGKRETSEEVEYVATEVV